MSWLDPLKSPFSLRQPFQMGPADPTSSAHNVRAAETHGGAVALPTGADILNKITNGDQMVLEKGLTLVRQAYEDEERRRATIETKATTLVSALGIAVSVSVSAGGLILGNALAIHVLALIAFVALYIWTNLCLVLALWSSLNALRVGFVARPDATEFLEKQDGQIVDLLRDAIASLLASYQRNEAADNRKVGYLDEGHAWFRRAGYGLVANALFIGGYSLMITFWASSPLP